MAIYKLEGELHQHLRMMTVVKHDSSTIAQFCTVQDDQVKISPGRSTDIHQQHTETKNS